MVNTISTRGEQAHTNIEPQAGGKEIQQVKDDTRTSLGHLWKALTLSTMILVGPSVFGQQTTQKVEASKSQQMTAMKGGNDTAILANNGPTTKTETNPFDEEGDDKKLEEAKKKAQEAKQKAQTAEQKAQTAEQKAQTAEQKAQTAKEKLEATKRLENYLNPKQ